MSDWTRKLHDYWKSHCVDNSWKHVSLEISQDSMRAFIEHIEFQETLINYWEDLAKSQDREFMLCKHTSALMTRLHDEKCVKIDALTARVQELEGALKKIADKLPETKRSHYYCEDCWYSCPKSEDGCCNEAEGDECNCGADKVNAIIDGLVAIAQEVLK